MKIFKLKMKKLGKLILINILVLFLLFGVLEFSAFMQIYLDAKFYLDNVNHAAKDNGEVLSTMRYAPIEVFNQHDFESDFRKTYIGSEKKGSILFFGCSYTYGSRVQEEDSFPYLTGKISNRTSINRGIPGGSIRNSLFDLTHENLYETLDKLPLSARKPEYIIYTDIPDHANRISNPYRSYITQINHLFYSVYPDYNVENDRYIEKYPSKLKLFLYSLYTVKSYYFYYSEHFQKKKKHDKMFELLYTAREIMKKKFPGAKFIILLYRDAAGGIMPYELQEKLKENGFVLLDAEKIAGHELHSEKWRADDKEHPSAAAHLDVANGLVKVLNL